MSKDYINAYEELAELFRNSPAIRGDLLLHQVLSSQAICEKHGVPQEDRAAYVAEAYLEYNQGIDENDMEAVRVDLEEFFG